MKRGYLVMVTVFLILNGANQVDALETSSAEPKKVEVMDELTVTATRTERIRSEVPASVTIITKKQIAESPEKNLDEILRQQAGVDLSRRNGIAIGIPARIDLRGVPGPNRTLVLVDGYPLNGSGTGFVTLQQIPLKSIERVEIVRGPFSALYGANALGGVINVITKRGRGKPEISVLGGGGTWSWYQAGAQSGGGSDKAHYFIYGDTRRTHNYYFNNYEFKARFNPFQNRSTIDGIPSINRFYEDWRHLSNYGVALSDTTSITFQTRYFKNNTGLGLTDNLTPTRDERTRGETVYGGLTVKTVTSERLSLLLRGYVRQYTDQLWSETSFLQRIFIPFPPPGRFITVPGFGPSYSKQIYRDFQVEGQVTFILGKHQTLTGGFDFLGVQAQYDPVVNADTRTPFLGAEGTTAGINTFGFYLQDEIQLGKLRIIPGLRVDKHSLFEAVLSPKLGISYQLTKNTFLRTSVGRAYRAPSVTELFRPEWNLSPFVRLRPNRSLKPEFIWSVDGGIEHRFTPTLRVSLDGFYNNMKDFIITEPVPGSSGVIQYQNLADSWSAGLEASIEWRALKWLTFFGNYTFLQSRDKINDQRILTLPDHKFNVGVRFDKKWHDWRFYGSIIETFVGDRMAQPLGTDTFVILKPYAITNVAMYACYKGVATVGVTLQNLFDKQYMDTYGYLGPGRLIVFYGGLRGRF